MNRTQKWQKIALKRGLIMGDMKKQNDALEQQNRDLRAALEAVCEPLIRALIPDEDRGRSDYSDPLFDDATVWDAYEQALKVGE